MALLGGAGSAIGGLFSAGASQKAAQAQSQASMMSAMLQAQEAAAARAQQERMYREGVERMEPFRQGGVAATNRMQELYGIGGQPTAAGYGSYAQPFSMADYQADPGYEFRVREGERAMNRSAAAAAGLQSGGALRAAQRYGQEMGSQEYGNAYNRFLQQRELQMRSLQGLASPGSSMASTGAQLGVQSGQNIANTMMQGAQAMGQGIEQAGQARASSYMGGASALSGALNAIPQNYMMYSMMDRYAPAAKNAGMSYGPQMGYNPVGTFMGNMFGY
jgi:hypothetical protein